MKLLFFLLCFLETFSSLSAQTPFPAGSSYELGFSPGGTSLAVVEEIIHSAHRELFMAAYEMTSRPIAKALVEAVKRGVRVAVVADERASRERASEVRFLKANGVAIRVNGRYAIMHHKFIVIDGVSVETGSFNYSESAVRRNAENALVLWNVPTLAAEYRTEWLRLWNEAEPVR
jgi:phosphatidylserine/phosphatidylglycerophosphate/cardiolipin synthase-like enzyme